MTQTDQRKAKPEPIGTGNGQHKPVTVSRNALAQHLDVGPTQIARFEADGLFHRQAGGFPLDQSRVAYIRHLRRERKHTPRSEADTAFTAAKAQLIQMRIAEKSKTLVDRAEWTANTEKLIGIVLTKMNGMAIRCAGRDLTLRRTIDQVVYETRAAIAEAFNEMADQQGEPPLNGQD